LEAAAEREAPVVRDVEAEEADGLAEEGPEGPEADGRRR